MKGILDSNKYEHVIEKSNETRVFFSTLPFLLKSLAEVSTQLGLHLAVIYSYMRFWTFFEILIGY